MTAAPLHLSNLFGSGPLRASKVQAAKTSKGRARGAAKACDQRRPEAKAGRIIHQKTVATVVQAVLSQSLAESVVDKRTDEYLLELYLRGDRAAFTNLMGRYSNELLHFLTRFLGSRAAADDVFQETFLQIHLSADTFDPDRRFKPWLFTIAANKARDYHRKHSRGGSVSLSASIDSEGEGERFVDLLQANIPNPDMPLLDAERSRLVKKAVDSLPVHLREILLLSYFQGFSYNQIADSLEIPLGTVKSRLHTAVAAFARAWKAARGHEEVQDRMPDGGRTDGKSAS